MTWSVALVTGLGLALLSPSAIQARTFQCRAGDVACLIEAITQANAQPGPQHEIRLAAGTYTLTAVNNKTDGLNGLPSITSQLTIRGAGRKTTIIERQASTAAAFRLMHVSPTGFLMLEQLTLQGGLAGEDFEHRDFFGRGGGLSIDAGTVTILNSTIASNTASRLTSICVAEGFLGGGGLLSFGGSTVTLQNTILARNIGGFSGPDCLGSVTSLGDNVVGDPTGCDVDLQEGTDVTGDPGLSAYTDDGTPGQGHFPLLSPSPAINAGNPAVCPKTDQLGEKRVGICDIGAIEFQGAAVSSR
jgi:hypothetical protein